MRFSFLSILLLVSIFSWSKSSVLLKGVEDHYKSAQSVSMKVKKTVRMTLLQKERKSEGKMVIKKGGLFRWDTDKPEKSLVLMDGKSIWIVDYPLEAEDKVRVIQAKNPKKSQPHAVVAFLMGKGNLTDEFEVVTEKSQGADLMEIQLKAKQEEAQIPELTLVLNSKKNTIETITYEDDMGNETELSFSGIEFDKPLKKNAFQFSPPKGAEVETI